MWRRNALPRLMRPPPVALKRLAAPLLVFNLGMYAPCSGIAPGASQREVFGNPVNYLLTAVTFLALQPTQARLRPTLLSLSVLRPSWAPHPRPPVARPLPSSAQVPQPASGGLSWATAPSPSAALPFSGIARSRCTARDRSLRALSGGSQIPGGPFRARGSAM